MNRAFALAAALGVVAVVGLANPLYVSVLPEATVLAHPAASGAGAAKFAPDLRYLVSLALSTVGVLALVGALAAAFAAYARVVRPEDAPHSR